MPRNLLGLEFACQEICAEWNLRAKKFAAARGKFPSGRKSAAARGKFPSGRKSAAVRGKFPSGRKSAAVRAKLYLYPILNVKPKSLIVETYFL